MASELLLLLLLPQCCRRIDGHLNTAAALVWSLLHSSCRTLADYSRCSNGNAAAEDDDDTDDVTIVRGLCRWRRSLVCQLNLKHTQTQTHRQPTNKAVSWLVVFAVVRCASFVLVSAAAAALQIVWRERASTWPLEDSSSEATSASASVEFVCLQSQWLCSVADSSTGGHCTCFFFFPFSFAFPCRLLQPQHSSSLSSVVLANR